MAQGTETILTYAHHAIVCSGKNCTSGLSLIKYLKRRLQEEGLDQGKQHVRANRAGCLGICTDGPIMVVYPEGIWYHKLDEAAIEQIISSHFLMQKPVEQYIFHNNSEKSIRSPTS